jgi:3-oxoacyl-[acyl-carrier protein] reductase
MEVDMDLGLKDKVAMVAAASRGLGRAAAQALAAEGCRVSLCSRSEAIHEVAQEIRQSTGTEALGSQADVAEPEQVARFAGRTLEQFGQVDILIINAGGPPPGTFLELNPEAWRKAIDLTLMSAVQLLYEVLPHMVNRGEGSIVTSQSFTVKQPLDNLTLSNSLRLGVIGLMKSLANEVGPKGIRVNSINPAWTMTERIDQLMADRADRSGTKKEVEIAKLADTIPLRRVGTVEEFGRAIAWLASPAASFIHGHALMFDGGVVQAPL